MFSCFSNPSNSNIDYRIFNVHMFLCMRIHTGVGHTDIESAQLFDSEKLTIFVIVPRAGFKPLVMESIGYRG